MELPATARLRLLAAALLFSTGGAAIKACHLTSWQVASFRSGVAAVTLWLILPAARRLVRRRVWAVGAGYAATLVLFVTANKLTTAANTIFLQSTAPLYVLLLSPLLLREPVRRRDVFFMAFVAAGMTLFFVGQEPSTEIARDPRTGNLLALAAGVCWAVTLLGLRWLERDTPQGRGLAAPAVVAGNVLACLACLPWALPVATAPPGDWLWIGYLGILQIGVAYWFLTRGIREVPALEASLLLLLEPVLSPVWAWATLGETPGAWALLGGAVIITATLGKALAEGRSRAPRLRAR